jgi:hypothetical protein
MRSVRLTIALLAVAGLGGSAALAGVGAGPAPAAKQKSPWQLFPHSALDVSRPVLGLGWAANRIWVVTPYKDSPIAWSARVSGGRLTGFAQARVPADAHREFPIVDDALVVWKTEGTSGKFVLVPLLANGRLGEARDLAEDLDAGVRQIAPKLPTAGILDGVRVGDRVVWALVTSRNKTAYYLACCTESGAATDLSQSFARKSILLFPQLDVDTRGRLWLAWLDTTGYSSVRGVPRLLELDPATLAARSKALAPPGLIADDVELACAASCRLVAQSAAGDIVSWGPGERSPTRVASYARAPWDKRMTAPAWLIDASYRAGDLVVGYHVGTFAKTGPQSEVRVVRGNARGAGARVVGVIPLLDGWPPGDPRHQRFSSAFPIDGTFTPSGLVATAVFQYTPPTAPSPVVGAVVPLRR